LHDYSCTIVNEVGVLFENGYRSRVNAELGILDWKIHSTKWSVVRLAEENYTVEDTKDGNDPSTESWIKV
jgi:hypothetical protein